MQKSTRARLLNSLFLLLHRKNFKVTANQFRWFSASLALHNLRCTIHNLPPTKQSTFKCVSPFISRPSFLQKKYIRGNYPTPISCTSLSIFELYTKPVTSSEPITPRNTHILHYLFVSQCQFSSQI